MHTGKTILIAEDERPIAAFLEKALNRLGFITIAAYNGEEALKESLKHKPDAIILDILMPKLNGIEVLKKLREENSVCSKTPVIVLSALDKLYQIREAMEAGATKYLTKPMFTEDIIREVLECLKTRTL
ncbi:MAG: response regulator [Desulfobacteraceae bacterium]|nr:response regulator [Desulfobacteraceae bacterium]